MNPSQEQLSPESEKRRNKGKMRRDCKDDDNKRMCDNSAVSKNRSELAKAANGPGSDEQRLAAIEKEKSRNQQYSLGQASSSPQKDV